LRTDCKHRQRSVTLAVGVLCEVSLTLVLWRDSKGIEIAGVADSLDVAAAHEQIDGCAVAMLIVSDRVEHLIKLAMYASDGSDGEALFRLNFLDGLVIGGGHGRRGGGELERGVS